MSDYTDEDFRALDEHRDRQYRQLYGQWIRSMRLRRSKSQQAFAEVLGISPRALGGLERAEHPPSLRTREKIETLATEAELDWLDKQAQEL